ncbi:hypothetical protein ACTNDY_06105 [Tissierellaceae bacterium HCP3S3_D8]
MSRNKKILRNIFILAILNFIFFRVSGLYLTPLSAHEESERSIHYGPSEVVHIEDFDDGKYILCKYDKWISCNTVNRALFFFWRYRNQPTGFENDKTKVIGYTWDMSYNNYKVYGIINDDRVKEVQITLKNGESLTETEFYDDLFLFTWKYDKDSYYDRVVNNIKAYDADGNIVFEDEY